MTAKPTTFNLSDKFVEMDKSLEQRIKEIHERHEQNKLLMEKTVVFLMEASANNVNLHVCHDLAYPEWTVDIFGRKEDWRTIQEILGDFENDGIEPATNDLRKRQVWVYLRPKNKEFKHLRFRYQRKLGKGEKCKMTRQKSSYISMECTS